MTNDQKRVMRSLAMLLGFKVVLYVSIAYSAKKYRKMLAEADAK
jgi:hypothetical protein